MKLIKISATLLACYVMDMVRSQQSEGDDDEYDYDYYGPEPRRYRHIVRMAYTQTTTNLPFKALYWRMQNYGCHCFPGSSKAAGGKGGAPVDAQDTLCKELADCHKCVSLEFGDLIDVDKSGYKWDQDAQTGELTCGRNKDPAKLALCKCDSKFAADFGNLWTDDSFNKYYWLSPRQVAKYPDVSRFDPVDTCQSFGGGTGRDHANDKCCGLDYPDRIPYSSGYRSCCESSGILYNPMFETCCDGRIESVGSC